MATPIFPTALPKPSSWVLTTRATSRSTVVEIDAQAPFESRNLSRASLGDIQVTWSFTQTEYKVFRAWMATDLLYHHKWFTLDVPSGDGYVTRIVRFTAPPSSNNAGFRLFRVSAELEYFSRIFKPTFLPIITNIADAYTVGDYPPLKRLLITWTGIDEAISYDLYRTASITPLDEPINTAPITGLSYVDANSLGADWDGISAEFPSINYTVVAITANGEVRSLPRGGKFVGTINGIPRAEANVDDACTAYWGPPYTGVCGYWGNVCYRYLGGNYNFGQVGTSAVWVFI